MMKVLIDYPNERDEFVIVERMTGPIPSATAVLSTKELIQLQQEAEGVFVDPALIEYAVRLSNATRFPSQYGLEELSRYIMYGCSPRASINLIITAKSLAFVRGRDYILPQDVLDMAMDVMRHRLVMTYEAMSDGIASDQILQRVLDTIPVPVVPLQEHVLANA
jgi:MoxR-like ATPase